jgi:type II secretory pathway component PulF
MIFIIPKITESFVKAGSELPAMTQVVVAISDFMVNKWHIIVITLIILFIIVKIINSTY